MDIVNDIKDRVERASSGYSLSFEKLLQRGLNIFRQEPGQLVLYGFLASLASSVHILLGGPVTAGFFNGAERIEKGKPVDINDFFKGFDKFFPLFVVNLLVTFIIFLGLLLLIIPGIYFAVSYFFAHCFVWFYDVEATEAIRLSRKTVSGNFGQILLLCLILAAINFLGAMAFGVGLLITIPFSYIVAYAAFDDIIGIP